TGKTGAQGPKGETGAAATALWAVVEGNTQPNPTILSQSGAVVSVVGSEGVPGVYTVNFNRDVSTCAYSVSTEAPISWIAPDTVKYTETTPTGVGIQINRWDGANDPPLIDAKFTLAVFC